MSVAFQVYKFTDDIRDGRYLTANSDGSMLWTLTRGDAHKLARKEADTMAAWVRKVFIGHMAIVVPEGKSPWEVLRAKPRGTKLNPKNRNGSGHSGDTATRSEVRSPTSTSTKTSTEADTQGNVTVTGGAGRGATTVKIAGGYPQGHSTRRKNPGRKRKASPAQLKARAKFTAMVKSGRKFGRKVAKVGRKSVAAVQAFRKTNPARSAFQIAAAKGKNILYLAGIGLSSNRATASSFGTISAARRTAQQVRDVGRKLGVGRIAVVTTHDSPQAIRSFLLGEV